MKGIVMTILVACIVIGVEITSLNESKKDNNEAEQHENIMNEIVNTKRKEMNEIISEEEIVLNRYKEMQQAMIDKNEAVLNEIIKDETTFTHMSGMTQTKDEYIADIISRRLDYKAYTIENPTVTIDGNKAILKARVSLTANAYGANGTWPFNVSAYFEKIGDKWFYRNQF